MASGKLALTRLTLITRFRPSTSAPSVGSGPSSLPRACSTTAPHQIERAIPWSRSIPRRKASTDSPLDSALTKVAALL